MVFSKGFKNEFETAMVNEPSVFEPLKVYCISKLEIKGHTATNTLKRNRNATLFQWKIHWVLFKVLE